MGMDFYREARLIEIWARRVVVGTLAGGHRSLFRGGGLDFDDIRPYSPTDDIRAINWQVTARMNEPYVKQYIEERQQTIMLLVDISGSLAFGRLREKRELVTKLTAVLATVSYLNQDRIGLILFSDQIEAIVKPKQGRNHTRRLIHMLLTHQPIAKGTNIQLGLQTVQRLLKQRGMIFLMSDFLHTPANYQTSLKRLSQKHDLVAVAINDPLEIATDTNPLIKNIGLLPVQDQETGQTAWLDTHDTKWQAHVVQQQVGQETAVQTICRSAGVRLLELSTDAPFLPELARFLGKGAR